jgi:hypothetical protein
MLTRGRDKDRDQDRARGDASGFEEAKTAAPTIEIVEAQIEGHGESGLWYRLLGGKRAGRRRARPMAWPPTKRSDALWTALAAAIDVKRITNPCDDTRGHRVLVEVIDDPRCDYRIGRVFPLGAMPSKPSNATD